MYTKTIYYRIYSIAVLAFTVLGTILNFVYVIPKLNDIANMLNLFSSDLSIIITVVRILIVILSLFSLFVSFIEFSSMFGFADMISYEKSNSIHPMEKKPYVLSPHFYRNYGYIIFIISLISVIIGTFITIISHSIQKEEFICVPLIPILIMVISLVLTYITSYARYKAFGDLYQLHTSSSVDDKFKASFKENNTRILRGYCYFLWIVAIVFSIATIVLLVIFGSSIFKGFDIALGIFFIIATLLSAVLTVLSLAVTGCYYDNMGKMIESNVLRNKKLN